MTTGVRKGHGQCNVTTLPALLAAREGKPDYHSLLSRVVQPGERLEWIQRVSGGSPVDMSQAPAKLQVIPFSKLTSVPVMQHRSVIA